MCIPKADEMKRRVSHVEKQFREGAYGFQDLPMHLLNLEACRRKLTKLLKRKEQVDVVQRLRTMYPLANGLDIPAPLLNNLPASMKALKDGRDVWRVEWFYDGRHTAMSSTNYADRYLHPVKNTISKFQDMVGFCKWESAIKLWMESLYRAEQTVFYEGWAYCLDSKRMIRQKVRMQSYIYDSDHVVSITVVTDQAV